MSSRPLGTTRRVAKYIERLPRDNGIVGTDWEDEDDGELEDGELIDGDESDDDTWLDIE